MFFLDYYDSAENIKINRRRVLQEFERHSTSEADSKEFFDAYPEGHNEFDAQAVLRFLGY